jgi:L-aspartate oxidase
MLQSSRDRVVIVGGGIAGLATALELAPLPVTVLAMAPLGSGGSTPLAQGGIAAAMGQDDASDLHAADTVAAGAGLCDARVVASVTNAASSCVGDLQARGVSFDRNAAGMHVFGLEGAHSRRRVLHAGGDCTGRAIIDALIRAARAHPAIEIRDDVQVTDLVVEEGAVIGVRILRGEANSALSARAVVLATGGIGGLYALTTNPLQAVGNGVAMAARAGAALRDLEFVQFHPTGIALDLDPMPLATEALRGEGALLINERGERFMADVAGQELAPRDIVARAISRELDNGRSVFLDARHILREGGCARFPTVTGACRNRGLDPATKPIPVRPAAHYHMGGVATDGRGRSSLSGLWACGEVAATGLHGANRLASNSLLEALAFARWIAADIAGLPPVTPPRPARMIHAGSPVTRASALVGPIRRLMSANVGVIRHRIGMEDAIGRLAQIAFDPASARPQAAYVQDIALVGFLIAAAALARRESRGAHFRDDYPAPSPVWALANEFTLAKARRVAEAWSVEPCAVGGV